jgi:serine/threonine protein kinase
MLSADGRYTQSVDLWSCGCILAELLGRKPIFPGRDFKETLRMQLEHIGSRPKDELEYIKSDEAQRFLAEMPRFARRPWRTTFPDATPEALDLLDKLLQFHADKRITAEAALAHPFFDSVRGCVQCRAGRLL